MSITNIRTVLLQVLLCFIFYSACQAGYYNGQAYLDYATKGWYTATDTIDNPLALLGTIASVWSIATCLFVRPVDFRAISSILVVAQVSFFLISLLVIIVGELSYGMIGQNLLVLGKVTVYAFALTVIVRKLSIGQVVFSVIMLAWVLCLVGNYLSYTDPSFSISIGVAGWRGLFETKNGYAAYCLYSAILITPGLLSRGLVAATIATLLLLLTSIILTQGKTAAIEMLIYSVIVSYSWALRKFGMSNGRIVAGLLYSSIPLITVSLIIIGALAGGGLLTFSGRTAAWDFFFHDLGDWFLFGKGGVAALTDPSLLERATHEGIRNGAIDSTPILILYSYGIAGLLIWLSFIGICLSRVRSFSGSDLALFTLPAVISFIIHGFLESACQLSLTMPTFAVVLLVLILEKQASQNSWQERENT